MSTWKSPLQGWRWFAAWALLLGCLAALTRIILGLTTEQFAAGGRATWILVVGIPVAVLCVIVLLVRCFSSWRNIKRLLLSIACVAGLIAVFYAEEDIRGWLAWHHFKARLEAKGEKLDFSAFIPPPVADDQNFAMTPVVAGTYGQTLDKPGHRLSPQNTDIVNSLQMPLAAGDGGPPHSTGNWQKGLTSNMEAWQQYYRELSLTTNLFPASQQPQTPAADVLLALSKYDSTIEELRQAAALPMSRFPVNYDSEQPFAVLLPHLASQKGCAVVLQLRALAELEAKQSEKALADVILALRLTEKTRSEPFLISHLVRIAALHITMQPIWEGLAKHRWTDAQLSELERQLGSLDFVADYRAAIRAENACHLSAIHYLRRHPAQTRSALSGEFGEDRPTRLALADLAALFIPSGWFYQNALCSSKFIEEQFLPIGDVDRETISPRLAKQATESLRAMRLTPYTMVSKMLLPAVQNSSRRFALAQAAVNLARTACALERHRLAHGKYPQTLDALAPQFIAKVPNDPIGGQALRYQLSDDGQFVLYSIGWNERDDGGTVSWTGGGAVDLDRGDWVWQYPESPKS